MVMEDGRTVPLIVIDGLVPGKLPKITSSPVKNLSLASVVVSRKLAVVPLSQVPVVETRDHSMDFLDNPLRVTAPSATVNVAVAPPRRLVGLAKVKLAAVEVVVP